MHNRIEIRGIRADNFTHTWYDRKWVKGSKAEEEKTGLFEKGMQEKLHCFIAGKVAQ